QELWVKGLSDLGVDRIDVSFTISDGEEHHKIAEYVKEQEGSNLDGISVQIDKVPLEAREETEKDVDYHMVISTWEPDYNDPMTFLDMWLTDRSANRMDYSNEDYDEIIDEIREETDESERFDLMLEAEEMLMDEVEIVPLVQD